MKKTIICAPSRIYYEHPQGQFSYTSMVEYFAKVGIGAIDMSFETVSRFDDSAAAVLFSVAKKARALGIEIPLCHLSFYMPDPKNESLMAAYFKELLCGIDSAALMGIPLAVTHPIAFHSSREKYGDWVRANISFLTPLVKYAEEKGIKICIENMASHNETPENHLYGSCATNISALAEKLGTGICWDVGHANISGYKQSEQMSILKGKIDVMHIHDNTRMKDSHLLPFDGNVDWEDVAFGMRCCDFKGVLDVEVSSRETDGDLKTRECFGKEIVARAKRLLALGENR